MNKSSAPANLHLAVMACWKERAPEAKLLLAQHFESANPLLRLRAFCFQAYGYLEPEYARLIALIGTHRTLRNHEERATTLKSLSDALKTYDCTLRTTAAVFDVFEPYRIVLESKIAPKHSARTDPPGSRYFGQWLDEIRLSHSDDIN